MTTPTNAPTPAATDPRSIDAATLKAWEDSHQSGNRAMGRMLSRMPWNRSANEPTARQALQNLDAKA